MPMTGPQAQSADDPFSTAEIGTLRAHGVVLFADRVIFEAQAPMPPARIAAIAALCAGALPEALVALWSQTAGGRLDYDLSLPMNGNLEAMSWSELFWDGSDGYRDLQGWIEHEQELAQDAADDDGRTWDGRLTHLPFGGFEYLERVYAVVAPGAGHGSIVAWKHGLPPAWTHALHEDTAITFAADLHGAFAALQLDDDPLAPASPHAAGESLLAYLQDRRDAHGLDPQLMDRVIAFYRRAIVNWRAPLEAGVLRGLPAAVRAALRHAIATDDAALVRRLAAAGVSFAGPLQGSALATDVAVTSSAFAAAEALVDAGAPVAPEAFGGIDGAITPTLTRALLAHGAQPDARAIVTCASCGAPDSARLIAAACAANGMDVSGAFRTERDDRLIHLGATWLKVREGSLGHYLGAEGLARRIEQLRQFGFL